MVAEPPETDVGAETDEALVAAADEDGEDNDRPWLLKS